MRYSGKECILAMNSSHGQLDINKNDITFPFEIKYLN